MSNQQLNDSLDRAEHALDRLERAAGKLRHAKGREEKLRATVRDVVSELDSIFAGGEGWRK